MREEKRSTAADYGRRVSFAHYYAPDRMPPVNDVTDVAARRFLVLGVRDQHRSLVEGVQYDVCKGIHSLVCLPKTPKGAKSLEFWNSPP